MRFEMIKNFLNWFKHRYEESYKKYPIEMDELKILLIVSILVSIFYTVFAFLINVSSF